MLSWPSISEDTHNEEIDRKHDNGTLDANHDLLPGELNLTCSPCKDKNYIIINVNMSESSTVFEKLSVLF